MKWSLDLTRVWTCFLVFCLRYQSTVTHCISASCSHTCAFVCVCVWTVSQCREGTSRVSPRIKHTHTSIFVFKLYGRRYRANRDNRIRFECVKQLFVIMFMKIKGSWTANSLFINVDYPNGSFVFSIWSEFFCLKFIHPLMVRCSW